MRVASKTIGGLYDGATTRELDAISIDTAASLIAEEPQYSRLAARLLLATIVKEVAGQNLHSFSQSIAYGHQQGVVNQATAEFVQTHARKLNHAIDDQLLGPLRVLRPAHRLRPVSAARSDHAQSDRDAAVFLPARGLRSGRHTHEAIEFYRLIASHDYMPRSPTLFNSGTKHAQMSSCYLHDSPLDSLESIYDAYKTVAMLSKFSGGIGLAFHRVRSEGSLIRATNGLSNGIVPWLRTLDSSVAAVNQGGKRKGACCVYLEPWHADIESFLELRENTGDLSRRTYNLNLANWIPDLFMQRVEADGLWSLFDPKDVPHLPDLYGDEFTEAYEKAEADKLYHRQIKARDLYARMMRSLAETGNGWMTFKDAMQPEVQPDRESRATSSISRISARRSPRSLHGTRPRSAISARSTWPATSPMAKAAVSISTSWQRLCARPCPCSTASSTSTTIPIPRRRVPTRWRPVGLGIMGLQDVFFQLRLPFDSPEAHGALHEDSGGDLLPRTTASHASLPRKSARIRPSPRRVWREGQFQFDLWGVQPADARAGTPARSHHEAWGAQFAADRHRAHGDHCLDRGLL